MRKLPLTLTALLASAALAGCGSDGSDADSASTQTGTTAAAATGFPVTLTDRFGSATISAEPKRVVTVGFNEQDFALALGVKPVGIREYLGSYPYKTRPWAPGANSDPTPTTVGGSEISLEGVASTRPDLILGIYSFIDKPTYSKLSALAPTVASGKQYADGSEPWDAQLLTTGKALGREAKARQVIASVNGQFAAARKQQPELEGKSITIAYVTGGDIFVLNKDDLRSQFFSDLGLQTPAKYSNSGFEANISREQLASLDTDVIVLIEDEGTKLEDQASFKRLKAYREGRVIPVDGAGNFAGALGYNSPLSRPYLLKLALPRLAAAADGDPSTPVDPA